MDNAYPHSPAPWSVSTDPYPNIRDGNDNCILARDCFPREADADLIAAAPDLLSALHDADEFCQQGLNSPHPEHWEAALHDIMELVRTTIAKAKGA
jgi:hypothetical protein